MRPLFRMLDRPVAEKVALGLTETLCGPRHMPLERAETAKGPADAPPQGPWGSAPTSGQRRCRGAAPGVAPRGEGRRPGAQRALGWYRPLAVVSRRGGRASLASCWRGCGVRNRLDRMRSAPGVPGADRPWGDRAAVPCRPVTRAGARSHDVPAVRHTPQRSHAWFLTKSAPGWHGHRYQRSLAGRGHAPYG